MSTTIRRTTTAPGGYLVEVEIAGAYADGSAAVREVFVAQSDIDGRTSEEQHAAIRAALRPRKVLRALDGVDLAQPPAETRAVLERRMEALYADWQRWRETRIEAQARGLAAAVITALTAREDAAWVKYALAIQGWRTAV